MSDSQLPSFLQTKQKTTTLRIDQFGSGVDAFRRALAHVSKFGYQAKLRILKTELRLASAIPGTYLNILETSNFGVATVELPWITQAFDISSDNRNAVTTLVFEEGRLPYSNEPGVRLRREFDAVLDLVHGPMVISGKFESSVSLKVSVEGSTLTHPFALRCVDDEHAFVDSESGLVLSLSGAREHNGKYVHEIGVRITQAQAQPIDTLSSKEFLRLLRPGATLYLGTGSGMQISYWPNLDQIGPAIDAIDKVHERLSLDTSQLILADLKSEEFGKTLTLLDIMLTDPGIDRIFRGFILGPAAELPPDPNKWHPAGFYAPVLMNFKEKGLVLWVEGIGDVYIADNLICGFRVRRQSRWECDVCNERFAVGVNPELIVCREWPAIPLFVKSAEFPSSFKGGINHPIFGDVWPLVAEKPSENFSE